MTLEEVINKIREKEDTFTYEQGAPDYKLSTVQCVTLLMMLLKEGVRND